MSTKSSIKLIKIMPLGIKLLDIFIVFQITVNNNKLHKENYTYILSIQCVNLEVFHKKVPTVLPKGYFRSVIIVNHAYLRLYLILCRKL